MYRAFPGSDDYERSVAIGVSLCRQSLAGGAGARANVSEPDGEDLPADTTTTGEVEVGGAVTSAVQLVPTRTGLLSTWRPARPSSSTSRERRPAAVLRMM